MSVSPHAFEGGKRLAQIVAVSGWVVYLVLNIPVIIYSFSDSERAFNSGVAVLFVSAGVLIFSGMLPAEGLRIAIAISSAAGFLFAAISSALIFKGLGTLNIELPVKIASVLVTGLLFAYVAPIQLLRIFYKMGAV